MEEDRCLDRYLYACLNEINQMIDIPILGIIYVQIVCNCGHNNEYTSTEMKELLGSYLLFDKYRNFEKFVKNMCN